MSIRSLFALVGLMSVYCAVAVATDLNLPERTENGQRVSVGLMWLAIGYTLSLPRGARATRTVAVVAWPIGLLLSIPDAMYIQHLAGWAAMG